MKRNTLLHSPNQCWRDVFKKNFSLYPKTATVKSGMEDSLKSGSVARNYTTIEHPFQIYSIKYKLGFNNA